MSIFNLLYMTYNDMITVGSSIMALRWTCLNSSGERSFDGHDPRYILNPWHGWQPGSNGCFPLREPGKAESNHAHHPIRIAVKSGVQTVRSANPPERERVP